jgi:hypothetical protein
MSYIKERMASAYIEPNWDRYRGNNHNRVPQSNTKFGGAFKPLKYAGKKLCDELWEDLVYRLNISSLRVYKWGDGEWTDGQWGGACIIHLNDEELIEDISLYI